MTIDQWISVLHRYGLDVLIRKPSPESWSFGQIAEHIVAESAFYIEQIEYCLHSNENSLMLMSAEARILFDQHSFPDIRIKRDSSLSQSYPQPLSKSVVVEKMRKLKDRLNHLLTEIELSKCSGKTRHPGLGYFNAGQWLEFTEMHMRHHLRQKERIETNLGLN